MNHFEEIWSGLFDEVRALNDSFCDDMLKQIIHYKMITTSQVELLLNKVADSVKPKNHVRLAFLEGQRYTKELTCVKTKMFRDPYQYNGVKFLMILEDSEGYLYNYWGNSEAIPEVGESAKITFTAHTFKMFGNREALTIKRPKAA